MVVIDRPTKLCHEDKVTGLSVCVSDCTPVTTFKTTYTEHPLTDPTKLGITFTVIWHTSRSRSKLHLNITPIVCCQQQTVSLCTALVELLILIKSLFSTYGLIAYSNMAKLIGSCVVCFDPR